MKKHRLLLIVTTSFLLIFLSLESFGARKKKYKKIKIKPDQVAVYSAANFDSEIVTILSRGKKIIVSLRKKRGKDGIGLFHKIKYGKKKYGYITDLDAFPKSASSAGPAPRKSSKSSSDDFQFKESDSDFAQRAGGDGQVAGVPLAFRKYIGPALGFYNYTEKVLGQKRSEMMMLFGAKLTGPVLTDLPLDITFLYMAAPPSFYDNANNSGSSASGMGAILESSFYLPLMTSGNFLMTYGIGAVLTYTKFDVTFPNLIVNGSPQNVTIPSSEVRMGAVFPVTASYKVGNFLLRGEAKYFLEEESYFGFAGSIMFEL